MTLSPHDEPAAPMAMATATRQRWMAALARAPRARLEAAWAALADPPAVTLLRPPEIGSAMVRGRTGGTGPRFNLGEVTLTRCSVSLPAVGGAPLIGHGYVAGRDRRHAELAACFDALLQDPARHATLDATLVTPLTEAQAAARRQAQAAASASRVDFFTLVRGE
ncbi:phosphonate C-P lyase system protein PhnG [Roseospira goensis]|uniref:Alpha-D-ribose 1-methylphosphonate 5-triphosphate synthase subunit PhnG n=1 Tax=Roseospira goensis TaxID=391922 RepID=A0A7W6WM07_9PROT|nr:phosphonate C-P lyase system protein PhnG [Roseospira goensis]MBB4286997.1 alpha-D-ribose 1-methylphosphonate 5-triphosphate synthase subunit PhnG [Roseospira goensis]